MPAASKHKIKYSVIRSFTRLANRWRLLSKDKECIIGCPILVNLRCDKYFIIPPEENVLVTKYFYDNKKMQIKEYKLTALE